MSSNDIFRQLLTSARRTALIEGLSLKGAAQPAQAHELKGIMKPASTKLRQDQTASVAIVEDETRTLSLFVLTLLGLALGIVTGIGAVLFRDLINLLHNLFFAGQFVFTYDANVFTAPSRWGAFIILAPVIGGVIVTFLVSNFAPEAKGHGVPEVMDAIYYKEGVIRPIVALVKSLASAFAIGSGSSVGREGPIIQIGSAIGSTLGQIIAMPAGQRITLVAAGAGAGIAATFNTPIGGVMFAIELMLPEVSVDTFLPVAVSTGAATFVGRWFFGDQPAFQVPTIVAMTPHANTVSLLLLYTVLGALVGVAAAGFVRGIHVVEDAFDRIPSRYLRHVLGMLMVGVADVRAVSQPRPILCRWRRLCARSRAYSPATCRRPGCSACCSSARRWRLRPASVRVRRGGSSRPRCSWARRSAAASPRC